MRLIRDTIKKSLGFTVKSFPNIIRRKLINGLTIFVYHEISDSPSSFAKQYGLAVSKAAFLKQIQWIKSTYTIIHPKDLVSLSSIPEHAAIISFDDGFLGSFDNGLSILEDLNVPSILFVNMYAILENRPIISAVACFLSKYAPEFLEFSKEVNLEPPFHLTLTPALLDLYQSNYGLIDEESILEYQGKFADLNTLKKWDNKKLVSYGNHLYNHWNAVALNIDEIESQYKRNEEALSQFKSSLNLFAFTNGQPGSCFSERDVEVIENLGARKIFSASGRVNRDTANFLLHRMSLYERDTDESYIWFQLGRAMLKDILHK